MSLLDGMARLGLVGCFVVVFLFLFFSGLVQFSFLF